MFPGPDECRLLLPSVVLFGVFGGIWKPISSSFGSIHRRFNHFMVRVASGYISQERDFGCLAVPV